MASQHDAQEVANGMRSMWNLARVGIMVAALVLFGVCGAAVCGAAEYGTYGDPNLHSPDQGDRDRILRLQKDLLALARTIDERDALLVADTAIRSSLVLAREYELAKPPLWHNFLVNQGLKKRGLCSNWTTDLLTRFRKLDQKSFDFHWGIAHADTPWRIHNTVVVTGKGHAFEEGIVLDGWRDSGRLFWTRVKADKYPWKFRQYP